MDLLVENTNRIKKRLFTLKPEKRNGHLLRIHHTKNQWKIRLLNVTFNKDRTKIAALNHDNYILIVDFKRNRYWNLIEQFPARLLKFSCTEANILFIALKDGNLFIFDVENHFFITKLNCHQQTIEHIDFWKNLFLTSTDKDAIIWNLEKFNKIQMMTLTKNTKVKFIKFLPVTGNILTCFHDDYIQIWERTTFATLKFMEPTLWNQHPIRSLLVTKNEENIILATHSAFITIYSMQQWAVTKVIQLPTHITSIKNMKLLTDQIIAILSGRGAISFFHTHKHHILSELVLDHEIIAFEFSSTMNYLVTISCVGDLDVFNAAKYIETPSKIQVVTKKKSHGVRIKSHEVSNKITSIRTEVKNLLTIEKLRLILKEFGYYSDLYRTKIWEQLLQLPNNFDQYDGIIDNTTVDSFNDLHKKYPLENRRNFENLRRLLTNLTNWCNFFAHIDYLPNFVFPFVKVFENKPITCFEGICTIILNWCQYWFEYYPLPPANILAMVENLLATHDYELYAHYKNLQIDPEFYGWALLKSAFSEVLTTDKWNILWDHILTNEPAFILCVATVYSMIQRNCLFTYRRPEEFVEFFSKPHPVNLNKWLSKAYNIFEKTDAKIHPRHYLEPFRKIDTGTYPKFENYPDLNDNGFDWRLMGDILEEDKLQVQQLSDDMRKMNRLILEKEESRRSHERQRLIKMQLLEERKQVQQLFEDLTNRKKILREKEREIVDKFSATFTEDKEEMESCKLEVFLDDMRLEKSKIELEKIRIEDDINSCHYFTSKSDILTSNGQDSKLNFLKDEVIKLENEIEDLLEVVDVLKNK